METIFASELDSYRNQSGYVIIDVRERADYEQAHLKGAVNMPFEDIENKFPCLDYTKTYILYCDKGTVSFNIARTFEHKGYRAKSVIGGITSYRGELECFVR